MRHDCSTALVVLGLVLTGPASAQTDGVTNPGTSGQDVAAAATAAPPGPALPPTATAVVPPSLAANGNAAKQHVDYWLSVEPPRTNEQIATILGALAVFQIRAVEAELESRMLTEATAEAREELLALDNAVRLALQTLAADRFKPGNAKLTKGNPCFKDPYQATCSDRLAGFSAAAHNLADGRPCWLLRSELRKEKGAEFDQGYTDWWATHVDKAASCEPPAKPQRCLLGFCNADYSSGVSFRPAVQLGATFGDGLGFSKDGAALAAQFSGSLGARFFHWNDAADVHIGVGIGTSTVELGEEATEADVAGGAFIVMQAGVGFVQGLFGISYLRTMDPRSGGPDPGNGLSLFVDAAAAERLQEK